VNAYCRSVNRCMISSLSAARASPRTSRSQVRACCLSAIDLRFHCSDAANAEGGESVRCAHPSSASSSLGPRTHTRHPSPDTCDRGTWGSTFDLVRYNWTIDALEQVHVHGLTPAQVHQALTGPGPRLIQPINGATRRVLGRTAAGRLVEVWLRESG